MTWCLLTEMQWNTKFNPWSSLLSLALLSPLAAELQTLVSVSLSLLYSDYPLHVHHLSIVLYCQGPDVLVTLYSVYIQVQLFVHGDPLRGQLLLHEEEVVLETTWFGGTISWRGNLLSFSQVGVLQHEVNFTNLDGLHHRRFCCCCLLFVLGIYLECLDTNRAVNPSFNQSIHQSREWVSWSESIGLLDILCQLCRDLVESRKSVWCSATK